MSALYHFDHEAMATPWSLRIVEENHDAARWVAQEAFAIVDRLESDLSRFQSASYVSQLGRLRVGEALAVNANTYECLELAKAVWQETHGAFDVTVPPEGEGAWHSQMNDLVLCGQGVVEVRAAPLRVDLGGIGKGFAIDEIVAFLTEQDVAHAFVDAGGSTFYARGHLPEGEGDGWPASLGQHGVIALHERALSASGFEVQGVHVMDPRTGFPVETDRQRAWVLADSAALADALSTAALIMREEEIAAFSDAHPDIGIMLA